MGKIILFFLLSISSCFSQGVMVRVSNDKPNPGETIYLEYTYPTKPKDMPKTLWSYKALITLDGKYFNNVGYSYVYKIVTFEAGILNIPSFFIQSEGRQVQSPNIKLTIGRQTNK